MKNNKEYGILLTATLILLCLPRLTWPDEKQGPSSFSPPPSATELIVSQQSKRMIGFLIMGGNLETHQTIAKGKEAFKVLKEELKKRNWPSE